MPAALAPIPPTYEVGSILTVEEIRPTLVLVIGYELDVAHAAARRAREGVGTTWATISAQSGNDRLDLLVHGWTEPAAPVSLAVDVRGLRLTRALLARLADIFAHRLAATAVLIHAEIGDRTTRRALERMGFEAAGLDFPIGAPARVRFRLDLDRLPARFARWRARRAH